MIRKYAGHLIDVRSICAMSEIVCVTRTCWFYVHLSGTTLEISLTEDKIYDVYEKIVFDWKKALKNKRRHFKRQET